ncbi:Ribonuclease H domain [Macleaya cordata]|uniref:Ribonuclease H domain n=1 Tax=Macleaya cordata TaxID=56857 RepID=A0A200R7U8_MACCD|nr:Ribonuclease H domain [Macleaya cordata]
MNSLLFRPTNERQNRTHTPPIPNNALFKLTFNAFFYHVWDERNRRIFRSETRPPFQVLSIIRLEVRLKASMFNKSVVDTDYNRQFIDKWCLDAQFVVPRFISCYWLKPSNRCVMLNTDGSLCDDFAGFGAIIRNEDGEVQAAAAGSSSPISVAVHELQGLEIGLRLAFLHGFHRIQVGVDSKQVIAYVQRLATPPWIAIPIMRSIWHMIRGLEEFSIQHVYRETNRAADHLASLYPSAVFVEITPSSFAEDLKKIIFYDKAGKAYPRCIS